MEHDRRLVDFIEPLANAHQTELLFRLYANAPQELPRHLAEKAFY